ncbi:MAG: hypothetical protein RIQ53_3884, partial [Pseudomonadota bacterium]
MAGGKGTAMHGLQPGAMFKVIMRRARAGGAAIAGGVAPGHPMALSGRGPGRLPAPDERCAPARPG